MDMTSTTALWGAVVFSGVYHGLNPGMGWPLAVSAALMERKRSALPKAIAMLALGHFIAMLGILLPFSLIASLVKWQYEIRVGSGFLVIGMGAYLLINRRHPKYLARVHPARLVLWSFLAAMAHGAGLMLVPILLGITDGGVHGHDMDHGAMQIMMGNNVLVAFGVSIGHTVAMMLAGSLIAAVIYFWLGLKFLSKTWFNLDIVWAITLILVGAFGIYSAHGGH